MKTLNQSVFADAPKGTKCVTICCEGILQYHNVWLSELTARDYGIHDVTDYDSHYKCWQGDSGYEASEWMDSGINRMPFKYETNQLELL